MKSEAGGVLYIFKYEVLNLMLLQVSTDSYSSS